MPNVDGFNDGPAVPYEEDLALDGRVYEDPDRIHDREILLDDQHDRRAHDPGWENRDKHPVGTTSGTGAGAAIGATAGMGLGGPVGAVAGGIIGGIVGGAAGHGVAAVVNPDGDVIDGDVIPDPGT